MGLDFRSVGDVVQLLLGLGGLWRGQDPRCTIGGMVERSAALMIEEAQGAWPGIQVDLGGFAAHLGERQTDGEELHGKDLVLAYACQKGDRAALMSFEREYLARVPEFVHRIERQKPAVSEIQQILRERLLVERDGQPGKIAEYSGKGSLVSWLRVVAIRVALELQRQRKPQVDDPDSAAGDMVTVANPELDYLRVRYATEFRDAFSAALSSLDTKDRTILQLYLVDGLSIDRIGKVYQVHRATAARWIAATRDHLYGETHRRLRDKLQLNATEFESIVRLVRSQLDVSVRRILQAGTDDAKEL